MFIRYFVEIPRMRTELEAQLLVDPAEIFGSSARHAELRGNLLMTEIGFGAPPARITKCVELRVNQPIHYSLKTVLPISWRPAFLEPLMPSLDADIELAELGPKRPQLSISTRSTPPLDSLECLPDRSSTESLRPR